MERVATGNRVLSLAAVLSAPAAADMKAEAIATDAAPVVEVDPRELLERERNRVLETARDEGYAAGMAKADDAIRAAVAQAEDKVKAAHAKEADRLEEAQQRVGKLLRSLQGSLAESDEQVESLAVEIAYAVLARALGNAADEGTLVVDMCRQALGEYKQRPVVLRVAAGDLAEVQALAEGEDIRVQADPRLGAGQCRLETHKGLYETSVETRMEAIKQSLLQALASRGGRA